MSRRKKDDVIQKGLPVVEVTKEMLAAGDGRKHRRARPTPGLPVVEVTEEMLAAMDGRARRMKPTPGLPVYEVTPEMLAPCRGGMVNGRRGGRVEGEIQNVLVVQSDGSVRKE